MTDTGSPRFAMVAGEASGDLLAGLLLGGMRRRWPALQSFGIGGPQAPVKEPPGESSPPQRVQGPRHSARSERPT